MRCIQPVSPCHIAINCQENTPPVGIYPTSDKPSARARRKYRARREQDEVAAPLYSRQNCERKVFKEAGYGQTVMAAVHRLTSEHVGKDSSSS